MKSTVLSAATGTCTAGILNSAVPGKGSPVGETYLDSLATRPDVHDWRQASGSPAAKTRPEFAHYDCVIDVGEASTAVDRA